MTATLLAPPILPRDADGYECGTAAMLVPRLTTDDRPVTARMIRKWAWRSRRPGDKLYGMLPGFHIPGPRTGGTGYRLIDAARCRALTSRDPVR